MKQLLKSPQVQVDAENPFRDDAFKLTSSISKFTDQLLTLTEPYVLCLNSPWGTGKTTFIKIWKEYLFSRNQEISAIYINAWRYDYCENPLVPVIKEIQYQSNRRSRIKDGILKIGSELLRSELPAASQILIKTILSSFPQNEVKSEGSVRKFLTDSLSEADMVEDFKGQLAGFIEKDEKVVIFIDDLDRCKPSFAVQLLELLKHVFDVEGFIFVLALDKKHLNASIRHVYGIDVDTVAFLRKMVDFEIVLPRFTHLDYISYLLRYHSYFGDSVTALTCEREPSKFFKSLGVFSEYYNLSLRDLNHLFKVLGFNIDKLNRIDEEYTQLIALLLVIQTKFEEVFNRLIETRYLEYDKLAIDPLFNDDSKTEYWYLKVRLKSLTIKNFSEAHLLKEEFQKLAVFQTDSTFLNSTLTMNNSLIHRIRNYLS